MPVPVITMSYGEFEKCLVQPKLHVFEEPSVDFFQPVPIVESPTSMGVLVKDLCDRASSFYISASEIDILKSKIYGHTIW